MLFIKKMFMFNVFEGFSYYIINWKIITLQNYIYTNYSGARVRVALCERDGRNSKVHENLFVVVAWRCDSVADWGHNNGDDGLWSILFIN